MVVKSEDYIKNNPFKDKNIGIIVTSYNGHLPFLKYTLQKYKETGVYVIFSYDRHGEPLPGDILNVPDSWVFKHTTYGAEKRNGWLWDVLYAGSSMLYANFDWIFTVNGDCVWDKPENIKRLIYEMDKDGHDIMSASSEPNLIHTCNVLWHNECFYDFMEHINNTLSVNIPESYSPEVLLRDFVKKGAYKVKHLPKQPRYPKNHFYEGKVDHYSAYRQNCTWSEIIGYRNLGGEHKAACLEHLEPVDRKYFDLRNGGEFLNKHEQETLFYYLVGGDRRYLYKYWTEGEDSYWNRRYYDLEYFGKEELSDDSKRSELGPPSERYGHFDRWKYNSFILKDDEYYSKWKSVIEGEY